MDKIDIIAGVLGLISFIGMYKLSLLYVGPFVGGIVGVVIGLLALIIVSALVMMTGRFIEGRCND